MGRAFTAVTVFASVLLLLSCEKKPPAQKPARASVADEKSGFSIMPDLPLWDLAGGRLTLKETLQLGEKVDLLGQSAKATQAGKERDFVRIRRDSGREGWARPDFIVSRSILAVTTTEDAVVYSAPKNTAATTTVIPRMTVLAIHSDSGGETFIRVTAYDPTAKTLLREVFLRNEGVSAKPDDVQSLILLQLADASRSAKQKEAFLTSAIKDHPGSVFMTQLVEARAALKAASALGKAAEAFSATLAVGEDNVSVRDAPDEKTGKVVAALSRGQKVEVVEKTKGSYAVEDRSAPWYRIREPAGWVHGASLVEAPQVGP